MTQELNKPEQVTNETIANLIINQDDVTWQTIIYDLVASEQMNPWDINVSKLAAKFIKTLKELKEINFRITGKMVLASAILLKIKSKRLVEEDMQVLDNIINSADEPVDLLEELEQMSGNELIKERPKLLPRTPQPRKRKISVFDLVQALEKALDVEANRPVFEVGEIKLVAPEKKKELSSLITEVFNKVSKHFASSDVQQLTFTQLVPSEKKMDKVLTFIPLLHLETQRKVDMFQKFHLAEIMIALSKNKTAEGGAS